MAHIPQKLQEIADQVEQGRTPGETVRGILAWFDAQRRGFWIVGGINGALEELRLKTVPNFEYEYIDNVVTFLRTEEGGESSSVAVAGESTGDSETAELASSAAAQELDTTVIASGIVSDPTYRIGKLPAANNKPIFVSPDTSLSEAVTIMLKHDFSQLPVMTSEREVKGVVSWRSIGSRLAMGRTCDPVRLCMEPHYVITTDDSLFKTIDLVIEHEFVLVRDSSKVISGIVTASDLSQAFDQLSQPFLLLGEIENHVRSLMDGKFTATDLSGVQDPSDTEREIRTVSDLTFGEYIRLLENESHWNQLGLNIHRQTFVRDLDRIRGIRNDVMHFDPDGIGENDLKALRQFAKFLQTIQKFENTDG